MKNNPLMKHLVFAAVVLLPTVAAWGDLLPPPTPLRRIGYEVLVETIAAVAGGSMLLRWAASKVWKHPSDVTPEEVSGFKERLARILPTLRSKFDGKYKVDSAEWLAEDEKRSPPKPTNKENADRFGLMAKLMAGKDWRSEEPSYLRSRRLNNAWQTLCNDLLLSILESDAELRKECDGIPIEFLCDAMFTRGSAYGPPKGYEGYYQKGDVDGLSAFNIRADMESLSQKGDML